MPEHPSRQGAKVVLIENHKMGGDCLNYGCVPSKALLASGRIARRNQEAKKFGVRQTTTIDAQEVHDHVHGVIGTIAPHDSVERFEALGVRVLKGSGKFVDRKTFQIEKENIYARHFIIATGSRAAHPFIEGLEKGKYLTNETIFDLKEIPEHLVILGGGFIGVEMAQAYRQLGSEVTIVDRGGVLSQADSELVTILKQNLINDGINILENAEVKKVQHKCNQVLVSIKVVEKTQIVTGSHLLVAVGREPNIENLGLEKAGVVCNDVGIVVNKKLRTSNRRVFAIGDVCHSPNFTHCASYQAGIVIRQSLFCLPAKVNYDCIPAVIYTNPELAQLGLTEQEARRQYRNIHVFRAPFSKNDRAITERLTEGMVKVVATKKGDILGVSILAPNAGDLLSPWILAMQEKLSLSKIASLILPYPTRGEASKRAAGEFYTPILFSKKIKFLVRCLSWLR